VWLQEKTSQQLATALQHCMAAVDRRNADKSKKMDQGSYRLTALYEPKLLRVRSRDMDVCHFIASLQMYGDAKMKL
jgi:hypothetical protein